MCRLIGLCALNMGAFLTLFYTPVVRETRVTSAGEDAVQGVTESATLDCKTRPLSGRFNEFAYTHI
jgi:hypothetical protein